MSELVTILNGDCREMLRTLPEESVQCCVTSPPYFGLRSYFPDAVMLRDDLTPEELAFVLGELAKHNVRPTSDEI